MKDVVVIANFCRDFSKDDNGRFVYLCNELSKEHNVEIITSDFSHIQKEHRKPLQVEWPFKITFLHEPGYKKNISVKRFFSHFAWGGSVKNYLNNRKKPDVIYCAFPSLTAAFYSARYCEKNKVKFIIDVQDLWPEAFKMAFDIPVISDILFMPFTWLADSIFKKADEVIAVSDAYINRVLSVNKKCSIGHTVYLGTDLKKYDRAALYTPLYKKTSGEVWVGYCGSLAASYDIPNLIHAIKMLSDKGVKGLKLFILGDGTHKKQFEDIANDLNVEAVFTGRLPYNQMCAQLNECDIVVNPIKRGSAASIINKHADYAASGLPVVNSQENLEYRNLVNQYYMGLNCKTGDSKDMAEKLEQLILDETKRVEMGKNARRCAEEKFDRRRTYSVIFSLLQKL